MRNLRRNFKNQQGFNLIELMIVIAIIALLIGVGIPAYRQMVNNGNETSAAQSIQTIKTLQIGYAGATACAERKSASVPRGLMPSSSVSVSRVSATIFKR